MSIGSEWSWCVDYSFKCHDRTTSYDYKHDRNLEQIMGTFICTECVLMSHEAFFVLSSICLCSVMFFIIHMYPLNIVNIFINDLNMMISAPSWQWDISQGINILLWDRWTKKQGMECCLILLVLGSHNCLLTDFNDVLL